MRMTYVEGADAEGNRFGTFLLGKNEMVLLHPVLCQHCNKQVLRPCGSQDWRTCSHRPLLAAA